MVPSSPMKQMSFKGKAKAVEDTDYVDLDPVLTYRHLLGQNLGVKDPFRVIALCDSDAFYAACEMVRLGVDKEIPLVVLQWDSIIAVNYPARKFGITRMIRLKEALKKCPHLKVVHVATYKEGEKEPGYWDDVDTNTHKVSLDYYRRESMKVAKMFKDNLPASVEIEKASIDEAFFDYTRTVKEVILQRYPYLAEVLMDSPDGSDTPLPPAPRIRWKDLDIAYIIPAHGITEKHQDEERNEEGDETNAMTGTHGMESEDEYTETWHDIALFIAAELMEQARAKVREMGYTTSAGIARNKFLAKLTASYKKPNSQSVLRNQAIPAYLKPLPFQKIRFLGGKLGEALAKEYDASTVGDLLTISLDEMQRTFGESAIWVYELLRGIDRSEVKEKPAVTKSMLAAKNLPKPIKNAAEGHHWIRVLAAELALRLKEARRASPNLWPKSIVLSARKGYKSGRSKQAPFPFTREVSVDVIANAGNKLWKELVGSNTTMSVTCVQLGFTGIDAAEQGQRSIEGFLKPPSARKRSRDTEVASEKTGPNKASHEVTVAIDRGIEVKEVVKDHHLSSSHELSWTCPRCEHTIDVSGQIADTDDAREAILASLRLEHEDFHFAEDLAKESEPSVTPVRRKVLKPSKKKTKKHTHGIEKYFTAQAS